MTTTNVSAEEAAIRALEDKFVTAFNAGNVDAMMKNYIPDSSLIVFDVVPPRQHQGAEAYRKAWVGFFSHFRGTPKIAINDLSITVDGTVAFSHSIQHVTGFDTKGHPSTGPYASPTAIARSRATGGSCSSMSRSTSM